MTYADNQARLNAAVMAGFGAVHQLAGVSVRGDFVEASMALNMGEGMAAMSLKPMLVLGDQDVPANPVGLEAICNGKVYRVEEVQPDGHGLTVLSLSLVKGATP